MAAERETLLEESSYARSLLQSFDSAKLSELDHQQLCSLLEGSLKSPENTTAPEMLRRKQRAILDATLTRDIFFRLSASQLIFILKNFGAICSESEQRSITAHLLNHEHKLNNRKLFDFTSCCPFTDEQKKLLTIIFRRHATLSQPQLIQLMKWLYPMGPSKEFEVVVELLAKSAMKSERQEAIQRHKRFGLLVKAAHYNVYLNSLTEAVERPVLPSTVSGSPRDADTLMNPMQILRPFPHDIDISKARDGCSYMLDIQFAQDQRQRQRNYRPPPPTPAHTPVTASPTRSPDSPPAVSGESRAARPAATASTAASSPSGAELRALETSMENVDAMVTLLSPLPAGYGGSIYLSVSPFERENTFFVGGITTDQPYFPIDWPSLLHKSVFERKTSICVDSIRLGIALQPLPYLFKKLERLNLPIPSLRSSLDRLPGFQYTPAKDAQEVVVSFGELQTFKVTPEDTFGSLMIRACRRWQVDPSTCECQDANFKAYDTQLPVLQTLSEEGPLVVRLANTQCTGAGGAQAHPFWGVPGSPPAGGYGPFRPSNAFY
mmetsp:Transcript_16699/g.49960  ORF Transcript_16699/g.49960 Transcript_16699/m.49960 type:complete len:550 (-) Transcript_16699:28-1677(-)